MGHGDQPKQYDLEDRTFRFAQAVRAFVRKLPGTLSDIEDVKQLVRASGSVGSNYIEANEALSKKDFVMRIKISRKEAKESRFFLRLPYTADKKDSEAERAALIQEAAELTSIFGSIVRKSEWSPMPPLSKSALAPPPTRFGLWIFGNWDLFRISSFGFRIQPVDL
jgi:four helix bundle protein